MNYRTKLKKGSKYFCEPCKKLVDIQGYICDGKVLCEAHYLAIFPKFKGINYEQD